MMSTLPFQQNKLLSNLCTFGIGGPARYYIEVHTAEEMRQALMISKKHQLPYFILGKGSNCLFDDRGFDGLVILNKIDFIEYISAETIHVGAGYSFSLLGTKTARKELSGLEFASGIPGTVGGAIYMNAGANGHETCEALVSIDFVTEEGISQVLPKEDLHFAYRTSSFQKMSGAIVGATFTLTPSATARPKQLEIITYRKKTQPYSDMSAGCIFRNPVSGHAGALIEKSDLKGFCIGEAKVSEMHANFIVNTGNATSQNVLKLIDEIKNRVKEKMGIELESEVRYIPFQKKE
jgi:UDP-N-acetylmuramate dehydrogenase